MTSTTAPARLSAPMLAALTDLATATPALAHAMSTYSALARRGLVHVNAHCLPTLTDAGRDLVKVDTP